MATTLIVVDCKLFQMMLYIIMLKVRKFHQPTANRFSTPRKKPVGVGGHNVPPPPPSLNRVKVALYHRPYQINEMNDSRGGRCFEIPLK